MSETFEIARKNMVINQLRPNKINEEKILKIFENIPKENFLDMSLGKNCYLDKNLDITEKRGYLKNLHLAQIIKYSEISPNDKVLHLGGLTGYFSTIISSLSKELLVVEENKELFKLLEQNVKKNNTVNINLFNKNLLEGLSEKSPFDLIIIDGPIYEINDNFRLKFEITNIEDRPEYYYWGYNDRLSQYDEYGTSYAIGFTYNN